MDQYDHKSSFSCRWWGGGQGDDHRFLLFKALDAARLTTQSLFHFQ